MSCGAEKIHFVMKRKRIRSVAFNRSIKWKKNISIYMGIYLSVCKSSWLIAIIKNDNSKTNYYLFLNRLTQMNSALSSEGVIRRD